MEKDVLRALQMRERAEAVRFLKQLWSETPTPCPKCGSIYKTIRILDALQEP